MVAISRPSLWEYLPKGDGADDPKPGPVRRFAMASSKDILIVDDTPSSARLFVALLESPRYRLRVVRTGLEALAACRESKPDLILLDLLLPEMDGFEVARRLRQQAGTRDIPILAVSAYGHGHATDEALAAGVDSFMGKPFSGVALREAVSAFVDEF